MNFLSQIINGLQVGSIYALVALGYSMVYGIIKLINFAHGDLIMVGGYSALVALVMLGLPIWAAVPFSIVICVIVALLMERVAYRRLLNHNVARISLLITAIGISLLLQNLAQLIFTSSGRAFPTIISSEPLQIGDMKISMVTVVTILTSVVLMIALQLLVNKTKMGKAMRATSEDAGAAKLMGINTNATVSFTFGVGAALASVGAVLYGASYPMITPFIGSMLGLKAFVAAVLGGIGNIPGAMLGGYILGIAESLTKAYISTQLTDAVVFGILIVVLLVKPSGIMGKHVAEKV